MRLKIKRFDKSLPLPAYQSKGAAAFDLVARIDATIEPGEVIRVPLNIAIQLPKSHWALVSARSSLHKKGLMMANGIGVGDEDYCGPDDEYQAALLNFTKEPVQVKKGERLAQMIIMHREPVEFVELEDFESENRGGFGSTGK